MKLRGSPSAILAIGAGVFIAALGFTGTWASVFDVIKGGIPTPTLPDGVPAPPGNDGDPNPKPTPPGGTNCQADPQCPRGQHCIGNKCRSTDEPGNEGVCPSDRIPINVASSAGGETLKCAQAADLTAAKNGQCPSAGTIQVTRLDANRVACWKTVRGAGRGPVTSYYDESPTGVMTLRGAPRERL